MGRIQKKKDPEKKKALKADRSSQDATPQSNGSNISALKPAPAFEKACRSGQSQGRQ